jgi:hypothetical protein
MCWFDNLSTYLFFFFSLFAQNRGLGGFWVGACSDGKEKKEEAKSQNQISHKMRLALWMALVALTWMVCCSFYCEGHSKKSV